MALVRIANKYVVQDIAALVIEHVKAQWPASLQQFDALQEHNKNRIEHAKRSGIAQQDLSSLLSDPACAVAFALEHSVTSILPAALYELSTIDSRHSSQDRQPVLYVNQTEWIYPVVHWELVDKDVALTVLKGKDAIHEAFRESTRRLAELIKVPEPDCLEVQGESTCAIASGRLCKMLYQRMIYGIPGEQDPLRALKHFAAWCRTETCFPCCQMVLDAIEEERQAIWNDLPKFFALE